MLTSDLGGGKTTFVRGLARGLGSSDHVASPTFTLSRKYKSSPSKDLTLYHFDFYRLNDAGVVAAELEEFIDDPRAVVVVEWPGIVEAVMPTEPIKLEIANTGEASRHITVKYPKSHTYLFAE